MSCNFFFSNNLTEREISYGGMNSMNLNGREERLFYYLDLNNLIKTIIFGHSSNNSIQSLKISYMLWYHRSTVKKNTLLLIYGALHDHCINFFSEA